VPLGTRHKKHFVPDGTKAGEISNLSTNIVFRRDGTLSIQCVVLAGLYSVRT